MKEAGAAELGALIRAARHGVTAPSRLYLVGATSHLLEGWRDRVSALELAGVTGDFELMGAVRSAAVALGLRIAWESPAEVIPLPEGWEERSRAVAAGVIEPAGHLNVRHFDPYSVVLRLVARGDEGDYLVALEYLRRGWIERDRLEELHAEVVPRFTRATLAQDPAEFRRKFSGLRQLMSRHRAAGTPAEHAMADTGMSWI